MMRFPLAEEGQELLLGPLNEHAAHLSPLPGSPRTSSEPDPVIHSMIDDPQINIT